MKFYWNSRYEFVLYIDIKYHYVYLTKPIIISTTHRLFLNQCLQDGAQPKTFDMVKTQDEAHRLVNIFQSNNPTTSIVWQNPKNVNGAVAAEDAKLENNKFKHIMRTRGSTKVATAPIDNDKNEDDDDEDVFQVTKQQRQQQVNGDSEEESVPDTVAEEDLYANAPVEMDNEGVVEQKYAQQQQQQFVDKTGQDVNGNNIAMHDEDVGDMLFSAKRPGYQQRQQEATAEDEDEEQGKKKKKKKKGNNAAAVAAPKNQKQPRQPASLFADYDFMHGEDDDAEDGGGGSYIDKSRRKMKAKEAEVAATMKVNNNNKRTRKQNQPLQISKSSALPISAPDSPILQPATIQDELEEEEEYNGFEKNDYHHHRDASPNLQQGGGKLNDDDERYYSAEHNDDDGDDFDIDNAGNGGDEGQYNEDEDGEINLVSDDNDEEEEEEDVQGRNKKQRTGIRDRVSLKRRDDTDSGKKRGRGGGGGNRGRGRGNRGSGYHHQGHGSNEKVGRGKQAKRGGGGGGKKTPSKHAVRLGGIAAKLKISASKNKQQKSSAKSVFSGFKAGGDY